jgi:hypothetical protein
MYNMKKIIFAASVLSIMLFSNIAEANPRDGHYNQRNQHSRINEGVRSGQLTRPEAYQLRMQQSKIRNYKTMAMADGRITAAERKLIHKEQAKANRNIYHQKHDRQVRHHR